MKLRNDSLPNVPLVASAVLLIPLTIYVSAYFTRTVSWETVNRTGGSCRVYRSGLEALAFMPATSVESFATGREITTAWAPR